MLVSEITASNITDYLKLTEGEYINGEITTFLAAAKAYIKSYTGMTAEEMDTHDDLVPVVYVLCQDMYDNRSLISEGKEVNRLVSTILGMYSKNLLPTYTEEVT